MTEGWRVTDEGQEETDDDHGGGASGKGRRDDNLTTPAIETQAIAASLLT